MRILFIEDDPHLRAAAAAQFEQMGWHAEVVSTYRRGEERLALYTYDAVLADLNLPGGDGLDLLAQAKQSGRHGALIALTARGELEERLEGLAVGADDYMVKPYHFSELVARIHAVLRRTRQQGRDTLTLGNLGLDAQSNEAQVAGKPLGCTKTEFDLLRFLVMNRERVVSKEALAEHLWGTEADTASSYDVLYTHIRNIRRKLDAAGATCRLSSAYGMGYKAEEV